MITDSKLTVPLDDDPATVPLLLPSSRVMTSKALVSRCSSFCGSPFKLAYEQFEN